MIAIEKILPPFARCRYDEHGEPLYTIAERLLLVLRRLDWATSGEILTALEIDGRNTRDRAAVAKSLERYAKSGRVLRRGAGRHHAYKLNAAAFASPASGRRWSAA